jgi:hypothetical protein
MRVGENSLGRLERRTLIIVVRTSNRDKAIFVGRVEGRDPPGSQAVYMVGLADSTHPTTSRCIGYLASSI